MDPLAPATEPPEDNNREPELPATVLPLLSVIDPEAPEETALAVANVREPVVLLELLPAKTETDPPI